MNRLEAEGGSKGNLHQVNYEIQTQVIGILRANGLDVDRLARHTANEPGHPGRYVTDALVLPDGRAIDFWGGGGRGQFHDLDVPQPKTDRNTGLTDPNAPFSSSVTGT